ncbi:MAG: FtsH protease activity modulator HflK [Rickettsiaceae bacterium]
MINTIYKNIFIRSPWDDLEQTENIFTKKRNANFDFNDFQKGFNPKLLFLAFAALIALWFVSGFYKVKEGEQALVMRFGKFNRLSVAGLNYHLPSPIEDPIIERVDTSRRLEIGYRSTGQTRVGGAKSSNDVKNESIMLTGDENIVSLQVDITWHITDLKKYAFNLQNPTETVKASAESAIREVVGHTPITAILSNQKQAIAEKIEGLIQNTLDQYQAGVTIEQVKLLKAEPPEEVIAAYRDVQTAKADKEKVINEAESYKNDILPKARGKAAKLTEEAEGYKAEIIARAKGDASRFSALYTQYAANKDVMRSRLALETIEFVLKNTSKVVMGGDNLLPHMAVQPKSKSIK